jgi:hypothetical protein
MRGDYRAAWTIVPVQRFQCRPAEGDKAHRLGVGRLPLPWPSERLSTGADGRQKGHGWMSLTFVPSARAGSVGFPTFAPRHSDEEIAPNAAILGCIVSDELSPRPTGSLGIARADIATFHGG